MNLAQIVNSTETKPGVVTAGFLGSLPPFLSTALVDITSLPERFSRFMNQHSRSINPNLFTPDAYFDAVGFGIGFAGAVGNKSPVKSLSWGLGTSLAPNFLYWLSESGCQAGYTAENLGGDLVADALRVGLGYVAGYALRTYALRNRPQVTRP